MDGLTPASADDLRRSGSWWLMSRSGGIRRGAWPGKALRIWTIPTDPPGHVAVVTETGLGNSVTESAGRIWAELVRRYGPSLVLLEHHPAPELSEGMETLDLVRIGADGSPHWTRVWPTQEESPRHAGLELWMAAYGYQVVSRPASWFDSCQDDDH